MAYSDMALVGNSIRSGRYWFKECGILVFGIFDENKKRMRSLDWRQDKNYLDYIDSGESAAVYIVKNIVKSLDTKNMWVDVVSLSTYCKRGSGNIAFNWIIVELFPRILRKRNECDIFLVG